MSRHFFQSRGFVLYYKIILRRRQSHQNHKAFIGHIAITLKSTYMNIKIQKSHVSGTCTCWDIECTSYVHYNVGFPQMTAVA